MPDEIDPVEVAEAERAVRTIPEYKWLWDSGQQWYTVSEIVKMTDFTANTIRGWCDQNKIRNAQYFGQQIGWRIPRHGLMLFFAEVIRESEQRRASGDDKVG